MQLIFPVTVQLDLPVGTVLEGEALLRSASTSRPLRFPWTLRVHPDGTVRLSRWWPYTSPVLVAAVVGEDAVIRLRGTVRETLVRLVPLLTVATGLILALRPPVGFLLASVLTAGLISPRVRGLRPAPRTRADWAAVRRREGEEYLAVLSGAIAAAPSGRRAEPEPGDGRRPA